MFLINATVQTQQKSFGVEKGTYYRHVLNLRF